MRKAPPMKDEEIAALRLSANLSNALWVDAEKEIEELYAVLKDVTELAEALSYNANSPTLIRARSMLAAYQDRPT